MGDPFLKKEVKTKLILQITLFRSLDSYLFIADKYKRIAFVLLLSLPTWHRMRAMAAFGEAAQVGRPSEIPSPGL
jgi:hypothetical protein